MTIYELPKYMIICLTLTIIIEVLIACILKIKKKDLIIVVLVNILTNPLLVSITTTINFLYKSKIIITIILEVLAVFIEGYIYKNNLDYKNINPYCLSLVLNFISYIVGVIIWA